MFNINNRPLNYCSKYYICDNRSFSVEFYELFSQQSKYWLANGQQEMSYRNGLLF